MENNKKQVTAVDWLIEEIDMQYPEIHVRWKEWMIDKAKAMEKEQIMNDYLQGIDSILEVRNEEEYYNETYGK